MFKSTIIICICLTFLGNLNTSLIAQECMPPGQRTAGELIDYQNYNHGYFPTCDAPGCATCAPNCEPCEDNPSCDPYGSPAAQPTPPCAPCNTPCNTCPPPAPPCASECGTDCGISIWAVGLGLVAIGAAAAIIVSSGNGSHH